MIHTVADLLFSVAQRERDALDRLDIKHGPTIGDMYEGLTKNLLDKSLPVGGVSVSDFGLVISFLTCSEHRRRILIS